ncbi:MAG: hypothetical protein OXE05_05645 [Chloroflexi bacterium]|nr:hypothetical protein [Chloroflexota bacterium]
MQESKDIFDRIDAYLAEDLSHDELFHWLLEAADRYCEVGENALGVNVWARTLNMLCLLQDGAVEESAVQLELQALGGSRPARTCRIEISKSLVEQGGNMVVWEVSSIRPGNSDSADIQNRNEEWAIAR